jgi:type VI secretion system protein ImpM
MKILIERKAHQVIRLFKKKYKRDLIYANDLVGCIGKLPVHKEFIKHYVTRPKLAHLDQWHQSAFHILRQNYGNEIKTIFSQMPLHNYIYYINNSQPMIGAVMPSYDQSGRIYPYIVFRILENPLAQEFISALPMMYADYFNAVTTICNSCWENKLLPDVFSQIDGLNKTATHILRRDILEITVTSLNKLTLNNYWQNISQQYSNLSLESFIQAIFNALNIVHETKGKNPWGLRLPLATGNMSNTNIIFWLQLIQSALAKQEIFLQIFWNRESNHHKAALTIFFKPMPANYFTYLVDQHLESDELSDVVKEAKTITNISESVKQITSNINTPLIEVLQKLTKCN